MLRLSLLPFLVPREPQVCGTYACLDALTSSIGSSSGTAGNQSLAPYALIRIRHHFQSVCLATFATKEFCKTSPNGRPSLAVEISNPL